MTIPTKSHHLAILSSPGLGHLTPILELAKRLVSQHDELTITIFAIVPTDHKAEHELLSGATSSVPNGHINFFMLPIEKQEFPSNLAIFSRVLAMVRSAFPALRASISSMEDKPMAMIVDQFGTEAIEAVGKEFNISKYYVFFASNAMFLSFNLFLPYVDRNVNRDEPFYIPGCEPIMGEDLLELTFSPMESGYRDFVDVGVNMAAVDGILVNTWEGLEPKTLLAFRDDMSMKPIVKAPVYAIGPLVKTIKDEPPATTTIQYDSTEEGSDDYMDELPTTYIVQYGSTEEESEDGVDEPTPIIVQYVSTGKESEFGVDVPLPITTQYDSTEEESEDGTDESLVQYGSIKKKSNGGIDEPSNLLKTKLMNWLDNQPNESVIYVSFGSGGTISTQQTIELAWGLELSKQRFIWVMRPPIENNSAASLFKLTNDVDGFLKYLPEGFIDRTSDIGYVLPLWAPQEVILSHKSIGAFVSHCGWNSILESIVCGVPIVAWPLYAEQNMNATMLVESLGIGVRPEVKQPSKGVVGRDEIARLLRRVMVDKEGKAIRSRVHQLQVSANKALEVKGSSYNALSKAVEDIVL